MAYECSRAGVDLVTILDEDKLRAQENLDTFLEIFAKNRMSILDTDQARTGHLALQGLMSTQIFRMVLLTP